MDGNTDAVGDSICMMGEDASELARRVGDMAPGAEQDTHPAVNRIMTRSTFFIMLTLSY
jgi:hypothetical protein